MQDTLSFKLSKKLSKKWYLDNIETKYFFVNQYKRLQKNNWENKKINDHKITITKTLTLDEVHEFIWKSYLRISSIYINGWDWIYTCNMLDKTFKGKTTLEVLEKFIIYCLDNDLDTWWKLY